MNHEECERKIDDYMLDKVLQKIKEIISIDLSNNAKIFNVADDKLPDDITLENIVILMAFLIKDDNRSYPNYSQKKHFYKHKRLVAQIHFNSFSSLSQK